MLHLYVVIVELGVPTVCVCPTPVKTVVVFLTPTQNNHGPVEGFERYRVIAEVKRHGAVKS